MQNSIYIMNEEGRETALRNFFYFENILPSDVQFHTAKQIACSLGGEWLGMSASQQLSAAQLRQLIEEFPSKKFTIVNLREETHFFLNGLPISITNKENDANKGKSLNQIEEYESNIHQLLNQKEKLILYKRIKKKEVINGKKEKIVHFIPEKTICLNEIENEEILVKHLKGNFVRIPLTDHTGFPSTAQLDQLVSLYDTQKKENSWVHFHCAGGRGRSSTAMTIFAILNWANSLSLTEILSRLELRGNKELIKPITANKKNSKRADLNFWAEFYQFAQQRNDTMAWSSWQKDHSL